MVKKKEDMQEVMRKDMRGGEGPVRILSFLDPEEMRGKMSVCGILTIPPGSGIGEHEHVADSEICYILEGELQAKDNGRECTLYPGDIIFTADGQSHRLWNASDKDAKLLAVVMNI